MNKKCDNKNDRNEEHMAIYVTDEEQERVILVGVELDPADDCEKSLEELSELAKTAGAYTSMRRASIIGQSKAFSGKS